MTREEFRNILLGRFPQVSTVQIEQFEALEGLYREWNARINVISRKDIDDLLCHHVLHSLSIAAYTFLEGKVLDLGTGGGFPGIPLAIMFPEVQFTLCDSIGKKIKVASSVAESLGLRNVTTANARAESLPGPFDWIVSRAVTSLDNFLPWVKGKYVKGVICLKGGDICEEVSEAMAHHSLKKDQVSVWPVGNWLSDDWFREKFVVSIGI